MDAKTQIGRYEIRSKLGAGGMGEVYLAHDTQLNRAVALKILSKEFSLDEVRRQRFKQEARAASALNHPNIITIHEIGESDEGWFIAHEYVEGETLRHYLKDSPLENLKAVRIAGQIAQALVAAHDSGIVHRDIKPENVMIRKDGYVKVLDFGLAKPSEAQGENDAENARAQIVDTIPGMVLGSVRYMSPEQARGLAVDGRTDIWSLGVVLYEMLTGRPPFQGATTGDTLAAVIHLEPVPLANLVPNAPAELQRIIRKSLQKDRDERYQNSKDLALDLKNLLYEIEHEISAENRTQSSGERWDISENPTMIHQTQSANHPTHISVVPNTGAEKSAGKPGRRGAWISLLPIGALMLLAVLGFGFYRWLGANQSSDSHAFGKLQVSALNSDGKAASPTISPDGKYIAYLNGEVGNISIVVRQISTDSTVTVVPPTALNLFGISFSPEGDYVYYLQSSEDNVINTLYRIPTLGGASKKLIEDVDSAVTFSPDGKQLAFQRNVSKEVIVTIYTANIDGTNVQPLIRSDETNFNVLGSPKWSPDGTNILVRAFNNFGGSVEKMQLAEISLAEKKLNVLGIREWFSIGNIGWLKDNSGFLFTAQDTQNSPIQIWRASYPQGEIFPVTNDINNYETFGLSADGKTIVTLKSNVSSAIWTFNPSGRELKQMTAESQSREGSIGLAQMAEGKIVHTRRSGNDTSLWIMDADAANARLLNAEIKSVISSPVVTPDGRQIVFSSKNSGAARIWRVDADGKNLMQLTKEKPNFGDFNPQITPDGKTIIYQQYASGSNGETAFMKVSIDGGESEIFYQDNQFNVYNQIISPDGKYIVYNSFRKSDYDKKLRVASLENGSFGQIVKDLDAGAINSFIWSPDSKSLTFLSNRNGVQNLWRLPTSGAKAEQITDFKSGRIFNFAWSTEAKKLFIVRGIVNTELVLMRDANKLNS